MKNLYKRVDVFRCTHDSHREFENVVSVYHVLKEKGCHPHGCVYFKWMCRKLDRGIPCPKSYEHVGRKCAPCADYYDEKVVKHPQLLLKPEDYQFFLNDLRGFERWLDEKKGKELNCAGTIKALRPRFIMNRQHERSQLCFKGFLIVFQEIFIGLTLFEDTVYAILSSSQQSRLRLSEGDRLEFRAALRLDRGRVVLDRVHGVEIEEKSTAKHWTIAEARKALFSGKVFEYQYEKCLNCPYGSLVDIQESDFPSNGQKRRKLFCLKGESDPKYCIVQAKEKLSQVDCCMDDGVLLMS